MSVKESGSGNTDHRIRPVARIHTDFPTKFGIPRQSGLTGDLESRIVFEPEFSNPDAVRGIEEFSHLWLIWEFSENVRDPKKWSPTVRPPRLGGNTRVGVFATRSSFRPNSLGLSVVRLKAVETGENGMPVLVVTIRAQCPDPGGVLNTPSGGETRPAPHRPFPGSASVLPGRSGTGLRDGICRV